MGPVGTSSPLAPPPPGSPTMLGRPDISDSKCRGITVDSKKLEHGCRMMYAGCSSFFGFGAGGRSCSNFLASTVGPKCDTRNGFRSLTLFYTIDCWFLHPSGFCCSRGRNNY